MPNQPTSSTYCHIVMSESQSASEKFSVPILFCQAHTSGGNREQIEDSTGRVMSEFCKRSTGIALLCCVHILDTFWERTDGAKRACLCWKRDSGVDVLHCIAAFFSIDRS